MRWFLCTIIILLNFNIVSVAEGVTYLKDTFGDGNYTVSPTWSSLDGATAVVLDGAMKFTSNYSRFSAPIQGSITQDEQITINYRVKKSTIANAGGIFLVDSDGAGYGLLSDINNTDSRLQLRLESTINSGANSTLLSAQSLANVNDTNWHNISVLWNTGKGTFNFYVDGIKIGVTFTNTSYTSFNKIIAYGKFANTIFLDDIRVSTTPQSIVTVCSWINPMGLLNGRTLWLDYGYTRGKSSNGNTNYPIPATGVIFPQTAPVIGSEDYLNYQYQVALNSELPKMKGAGFDVVNYDMMAYPSYNSSNALTASNTPLVHYTTFLKWVEAAEQIGDIKMGIMAEDAGTTGDFPSGYKLTATEWINSLKGAISKLPNSNAIWKIDEKPVITMFGSSSVLTTQGTAPFYGWSNIIPIVKQTNSFYWIPDINPTLIDRSKMSEMADAGYCFAPSAPIPWLSEYGTGGYQMGLYNTFKTQTAYPQMPYYLISSPGYYNKKFSYTQCDFERIHKVYENAVNDGVDKVSVLTWNDLNEDHDIMPTVNKGRALLDIYDFYNTWLKIGVLPKAVDDNITISYPLHIPTTIKTPITNWGNTDKSPNFLNTNGQGRVFYWANLKTPQILQINNNTAINLPAGLSYGEVPLGVGIGEVTARVTSNGDTRTIACPSVESINVEPDNGGLNFRYLNLISNISSTITTDRTKLNPNEKVTATITFDNQSGIDENPFIAMVLYDVNNRVRDIKVQTVTANRNVITAFSQSITLPNNVTGSKLKVFVFKNTDKILPLGESKILIN